MTSDTFKALKEKNSHELRIQHPSKISKKDILRYTNAERMYY